MGTKEERERRQAGEVEKKKKKSRIRTRDPAYKHPDELQVTQASGWGARSEPIHKRMSELHLYQAEVKSGSPRMKRKRNEKGTKKKKKNTQLTHAQHIISPSGWLIFFFAFVPLPRARPSTLLEHVVNRYNTVK